MIVPSLDIPHWSGETLEGRTILVYAEQGLGDTFMCCRYLPRLVAQGAEVLFLGAGNLATLLRTMSEDVRYIDAIPANQNDRITFGKDILSVTWTWVMLSWNSYSIGSSTVTMLRR